MWAWRVFSGSWGWPGSWWSVVLDIRGHEALLARESDILWSQSSGLSSGNGIKLEKSHSIWSVAAPEYLYCGAETVWHWGSRWLRDSCALALVFLCELNLGRKYGLGKPQICRIYCKKSKHILKTVITNFMKFPICGMSDHSLWLDTRLLNQLSLIKTDLALFVTSAFDQKCTIYIYKCVSCRS